MGERMVRVVAGCQFCEGVANRWPQDPCEFCGGTGKVVEPRTLADAEAEALMADGEKALAFVREIFAGGYERGDWDGADLQDLGVKTGVLKEVPVTEPCCADECHCAEYDNLPGTCYRFALSLTPGGPDV